MKRTAVTTLTLLALATLTAFAAPKKVLAPAPLAEPLPHCQVPCGIYGDRMRIDMLMEDAATIEKGMLMLAEMEAAEAPNYNQIVRWVVTKEEHAQKIQDQVSAYWLAQRIKAPADNADDATRQKYFEQLATLHGISVAAMKCKQTVDSENVAKLRMWTLELSKLYFSGEDLEHIKSHHASEQR